MALDANAAALRRAALVVALLNLGYFGIEFGVALAIDAVSLLADSIDFLEDASVNLLIVLAAAWPRPRRALLGLGLAALLLVPGLFTLWAAWQKFLAPTPPAAGWLALAGLGALAINLTCAWILARVRHVGGSLGKAAFLSARNDAFANIAIMVAAGLTALTASGWPDLVAGLGIAALNADAAADVWRTARRERLQAVA